MTEQEAHIRYDSLKGIVNRMFISDDPKEVKDALGYAEKYLHDIHEYNMRRVNSENR